MTNPDAVTLEASRLSVTELEAGADVASLQSVTDLVTSRRARSPAQSQASGKPTMLQVLLQLASSEVASGAGDRDPTDKNGEAGSRGRYRCKRRGRTEHGVRKIIR